MPLIKLIYFKNNDISKENFYNLIISAGSRIREDYSYENEFRILRIIGNGEQLFPEYQIFSLNDSLSKILIPNNNHSSIQIKKKLEMIKAEAYKIGVEVLEAL